MNTYSEQLLEDYPTLSRASVQKLLREHGFELDEPTMPALSSEFDGVNADRWDETSSFDAELGICERYRSAHVMAWLGY